MYMNGAVRVCGECPAREVHVHTHYGVPGLAALPAECGVLRNPEFPLNPVRTYIHTKYEPSATPYVHIWAKYPGHGGRWGAIRRRGWPHAGRR